MDLFFIFFMNKERPWIGQYISINRVVIEEMKNDAYNIFACISV
jgi:hypothetical protein